MLELITVYRIFMIDKLIAETTECDFKVAVEINKPKSWLKSVSAFANGVGGTLIFGVDDSKKIIGLNDIQKNAEVISRLIKERITPYPDFILTPEQKNKKDLLILTVFAGRSTPYYYKADGIMEAYIRMGNESVTAPSYVLNQLILNGMNKSYDALVSEFDFKDYAFSKLRERYKVWTGNSMEDKFFDSCEMRRDNGKLTHAGALLADDSPIKHSRLFCTRWNGLDKSGGIVDALDSAEYSGSLIILLNEGMGFVKRNMKTSWKKTANSRIEMPEYCERSVFEALVNALIHRDYLILGSEVHIDVYDDRLTIHSPGGMVDGSRIQERDILSISSTRRNPVLADIFGRLGYMERQGSGFKKITDAYSSAHNYKAELSPKFYSDISSFQVTLFNLNYGQAVETNNDKNSKTGYSTKNSAIEDIKSGYSDENLAINSSNNNLQANKQAIEQYINTLDFNQPTKDKIMTLFETYGTGQIFGRFDVADTLNIAYSSAGDLISKMKETNMIETVQGHGKGKYQFVIPKI